MATSLTPAGARTLASTTKTAPQMRGISSRWLLRMLPWVATEAGVYRVNRRLVYQLGDGLVNFEASWGDYAIVPGSLAEIPILRGIDNPELLAELAGLFEQTVVEPGTVITQIGQPMDRLISIAHGRANKLGPGELGELVLLRRAGRGDYFGDELFDQLEHVWEYALQAETACVLLSVSNNALSSLLDGSPFLQGPIQQQFELAEQLPLDEHFQRSLALSAGHLPEQTLAATYVEYETEPTDIELSVAQALLRVNTRVGDLYNDPHDQFEHQLRLTVEVLRERQEHELVNNARFGLLASVDAKQRVFARPGPPSPYDLDELLGRVRSPDLLLAHPRAIAAFRRECGRVGISPGTAMVENQPMLSWRGVPMLPCDKLPISATRQSSILCLRLGEDREGVIGLHQPGVPDEFAPSSSVRWLDTDASAVSTYLVSLYFSLAVLVPTAVNLLDGVSVAASA